MAQAVFYFPTENVQVKQISEKVEPTPVQKHAGEQGNKCRCPSIPKGLGEVCRDPAIHHPKGLELPSQGNFVREQHHVSANQCIGHQRKPSGRDKSTEGNHTVYNSTKGKVRPRWRA